MERIMNPPRSSRLLAFARELQRAATFEQLLLTTRAEVSATVGYGHSWLMVADSDEVEELRLIDFAGAKRGDAWKVAPVLQVRGDAMIEEIVRSDVPVVVVDARTDPRTDKKIVEMLGNRTIINIPLRLLDKPFGVLGIGTFGDEEGCRAPTDEELEYLVGMASQLSVAAGRIRFIEERRRAEEALRKSEEDLRITLDSIGDGVIATDSAGKIVRMNPVAEALTGWRAADARGLGLSEVFRIVNELTREMVESPVDRVLREGAVVGLANHTVLVARDGTERAIADSGAPIRDPEGKVRGVVLVFRDQTDERTAETLRRANAAAETANAELEAFSYSVSHDLRAPLRAIEGFSKLLLEDYGQGLEVEARGYLQRVIGNAQRMSALIRDLLNLSRVTRSQLQRESIDISEMARSIVDVLRGREPNRVVEVDVASDLQASADPRLARIVLENLIANAWKFTSKKDHARIAIGKEERDGEEVFVVRDNGAGFDMAYVGKLFAPFQRLHGESEFEGTGVGLATVHRIVARHGGRIWAEAARDVGAVFRFTLRDSFLDKGGGRFPARPRP
jgi:PAS domain S-box-containing protein